MGVRAVRNRAALHHHPGTGLTLRCSHLRIPRLRTPTPMSGHEEGGEAGVTTPAAGRSTSTTCPLPVPITASGGKPFNPSDVRTVPEAPVDKFSQFTSAKIKHPTPRVSTGDPHGAGLRVDHRHTLEARQVEAAMGIAEESRGDLGHV